MGRCSGFVFCWKTALICGYAYEFGGVVFNRRHHFLLLRIPPFVGGDAVTVTVGASEKSSVSGSGAGIGVIVIAIGEVRSVIEEKY